MDARGARFCTASWQSAEALALSRVIATRNENCAPSLRL